MSSTYPIDEFENPDENGPIGAHRRPSSRWRPVLPFLLILVLVPLLAWGFTYLLQRDDSGSDDQSGTSTSQSDEQSQSTSQSEDQTQSDEGESTQTPTTEPTEEATEEPTEEATEEPEATVDYSTSVQVLNGSGIQGYAAEVSGYLTNDGFTSVSASNTSGWVTTENTVFYSSSDQEATAQRIAELAGIDAVEENTNATGGSGIVVLLLY